MLDPPAQRPAGRHALEELRLQGERRVILGHGAAGGDDGLREQQPAEDPVRRLRLRPAPEDAFPVLLELEQLVELVERE